MYPYIELNIANNLGNIIYYPKEGVAKQINIDTANVVEVAVNTAKSLDLIPADALVNKEIFEQLLEIARESDELYYTEVPVMDIESVEFKLESTMENYLASIKESSKEDYLSTTYANLQMKPEVKAELIKNQNSDIFASFMDGLYNVLIAKTLIASTDLGLGKIALKDEFKNSRLMEKMALELNKLDLELYIPEYVD